jgi:hypothetical protein
VVECNAPASATSPQTFHRLDPARAAVEFNDLAFPMARLVPVRVAAAFNVPRGLDKVAAEYNAPLDRVKEVAAFNDRIGPAVPMEKIAHRAPAKAAVAHYVLDFAPMVGQTVVPMVGRMVVPTVGQTAVPTVAPIVRSVRIDLV